MIFRVVKRLATGKNLSTYIEAGCTIRSNYFKPYVTDALIKAGAITPVSAPPLSILRGWKLRSRRLENAGYDALGFLEDSNENIAEATGYHIRSIKKWRNELEELLLLGGEKVTEGCNKC